MSETQDNAEHKTHDLFQRRWSPRAFAADKKVSQQDIDTCLEAARWAPSCFGAEPWRFIVCHKENNQEAWAKLLACLAPKNQEWAQFAPVLMMVCAHQVFEHNGSDNGWAEYDAGAASVSLCLQATSLGLVTHQMGGFDASAVVEKFNVPEAFKPIAAIALGYQGQANQLDKDFQAMEVANRARKPLAKIAFHGGWEDA
ncbi:MAG: nitroreductase family protein [Ghiorsea sp.]|nr:nitroreductase family protein [Ghiorsea sp.]